MDKQTVVYPVKVKVAQSCQMLFVTPWFSRSMEFLQARMLEWGPFPPQGSSQPGDRRVSLQADSLYRLSHKEAHVYGNQVIIQAKKKKSKLTCMHLEKQMLNEMMHK